MAHIIKQDIVLYGGHIVGSISVNGGAIRGEGGPVRPRLVVPVKIEISPQPEDAMVAVTSLTASLGAQQYASPAQVLCQPVTRQLVSRFPAHSKPTIANEYTEDFRFFLSQAEVEDIEALRHTASSEVFTLYMDLDVVVAALKSHNRSGGESTSWIPQFGMLSEVMPFWTTQIQPLQINIEHATWVNNVLPGLGYDRLRLIELTFPPLPDHPNSAKQFDKAKKALDERRYGDCIGECRGLLAMWEKHYKATPRQNPLAKVIGDLRGWADDDIRRQMLDAIWKEVGDVANAPPHPEGDVDADMFEKRDARLVLLLTAALSEYIEQR
jgi:hypothetical protein